MIIWRVAAIVMCQSPWHLNIKTFWAAQRQCHQFVFQTDQKYETKKFANKCSSVDGTAI